MKSGFAHYYLFYFYDKSKYLQKDEYIKHSWELSTITHTLQMKKVEVIYPKAIRQTRTQLNTQPTASPSGALLSAKQQYSFRLLPVKG